MKDTDRRRHFQKIFLYFICLSVMTCTPMYAEETSSPIAASLEPIHEIAVMGAPSTGAIIEGIAGVHHQASRHRFSCHSSGPKPGFLGPDAVAKPTSVKDQPGIFPAPLMGPASLSFTFSCHTPGSTLTPIVVRPDGTAFKGQPMTHEDFPQTLVVSSPAQTGIYTLFVLPHQKTAVAANASVAVKSSENPQQIKTMPLKSFVPLEEGSELISAEYIYSSQ